MATISISFQPEFDDLLPPKLRGRESTLPIQPGRAVKDLVEALGVPHTEIGDLLVNGTSVSLAHQLRDGDRVSVFPVSPAAEAWKSNGVAGESPPLVRFAADDHLGRLARYLRLAGFDTIFRDDWDDADLVRTALREHRVILTRDRGLLKRRAVTQGYLVRGTMPRAQLREVLSRFDLWEALRPFTRCSVCNSVVATVTADAVQDEVPPGTARSYHDFWRCTGCGRVYWRGAHYRSLEKLLRSPPTE